MLQGLSAAGEQAGANSMTLEHAPANRRAFFTSFTLSGTQGGLILATLVYLPIAQLPEEQLLSWGWRIPFFLSAIVVAVGFWVRRTLPETPAFEQEGEGARSGQAAGRRAVPRSHADNVFRVIFAALVSVVSTIFSVFTLSYAVNDHAHLALDDADGAGVWPTWWHSAPSRPGRCCRTASAAGRCSSSARSAPRY